MLTDMWKSIFFKMLQHSLLSLNLLKNAKFLRIMVSHIYHKLNVLIASPNNLDNVAHSLILSDRKPVVKPSFIDIDFGSDSLIADLKRKNVF